MSDGDYIKGYTIGYIDACQAIQGQLSFDEETGSIYLTDIVNWTESQIRKMRDIREKELKKLAPPEVKKEVE